MKKNIVYLILCVCLYQSAALAQEDNIHGYIYSEDIESSGKLMPLEYANIYWKGTQTGTISDSSGYFIIQKIKSTDELVVNYTGYKNDTVKVRSGQNLKIILSENISIGEVEVHEHLGGSFLSKAKPIHTEMITSEGLQKLACCNLAESFENSATVDVGFTDAISGARQIKMLGLGGEYSQIMTENVPVNRGLTNSFGLDYIPGTWMESIQVSKGTASVTNGYESITGQINIEYKKPENSEKLFLNFFGNSNGRLEANMNTRAKLNDKISTGILLHSSLFQTKIDDNNDGFLDIPTKKQINVFNRWAIRPEEDVHIQFGIKALHEERNGGQTGYYTNAENNGFYGFGIKTNNFQLYNKSGMGFHHKPYKSIGIISSFTFSGINGFFGNNEYEAEQKSVYSNLIYQSVLFNANHKFNIGASIGYDQIDENYNDTAFNKSELVPGVFGQYTFSYLDKLTLIAGIRYDYNNYYKRNLVTPRLHLKYNLTENTILRASLGKGYRSPNILAENMSLMASSGTIRFNEDLRMEEAFNFGINFHQTFKLGAKQKLEFSADYYRTTFENMIIVDKETDHAYIRFYNLDGEAYSNSYQMELKIIPLERLDVTFAYKFNDVKTTINNILISKPLVNKNKGLVLLSYATPFNIWRIDITNQFIGKSRLPDTKSNPVPYQRGDYSEVYYILHAQVTKRFKHFEMYVGGENLTNFKQKDPIISADDPFGDYFDASGVWGPVHGSMYYAGLRFSLK